jgi:alcohol dehydrogenase
MSLTPFDYRPRTRIVFGPGEFARLGELARDLDGKRCLLVADEGAVDFKLVAEAVRSLKARRIDVFAFHEFAANPTPAMVEAGRAFAAPLGIDLIVGLGRGYSLDMAKAINAVLMNGGSIADYRGYGKIQKALLPMIAVPTTAGAGGEALSHATIFDPETRMSLLCGDPKMNFRTAVLDPNVTVKQPAEITASSGYDAIAHAVETLASPRRTAISECFSREAWRLLNANFEWVIQSPEDLDARGGMQLGAYFAGLAIENSTLGPAHACAVPLVSNYGLLHGVAVGLTLPEIVEWAERESLTGVSPDGLTRRELAVRLRDLRSMAELPSSLRDVSIPEQALPRLAEQAAAQWAAKFAPVPFDATTALEIYRAAY